MTARLIAAIDYLIADPRAEAYIAESAQITQEIFDTFDGVFGFRKGL